MTNEILEVKYRPKTFEEFITYSDGSADFIVDILLCIKSNPFKMNHLILYGSPGVGKTTLAELIIKSLKADSIYLNASDKRGIDDMRKTVREFVVTKASNSNSPKIVFLDEADGLTSDAQNLLRGLMEKYTNNCRFIFTCNNFSKIIKPLYSRCKIYNAKTPKYEEIMNRLEFICINEKIEFNEDSLKILVDTYYPDMRKMIQNLENIDSLSNIVNKTNEIYNHIKECRKGKPINNKLIYDRTLNHRFIIKQLFDKMIDECNYKESKLFAEADYRIVVGSSPEIQFVNLFIELVMLK